MIDPVFAIDSLAYNFIEIGHMSEEDLDYSRNRIFDLMRIPFCAYVDKSSDDNTLSNAAAYLVLIDYARKTGMIPQEGEAFADDLTARIGASFMGRPSDESTRFWIDYGVSPDNATDAFYRLCCDVSYIKDSTPKKGNYWQYKGKYANLELSINTSKPEKTPEEIRLAKNQKTGYPKCPLCKENVGLSGVPRPPRANHRIIPLSLDYEKYYFQFSPYAYFNEHCIVLSHEHREMNLGLKSIKVMLDFVSIFPHYFISSNADLPIVGGSILSHDHFQGGRHVFPMEMAEKTLITSSRGVDVYKLRWPLSAVVLESQSREDILESASLIMDAWQIYDNEELAIISNTNVRHNALNLIARYEDNKYKLFLVFRNNRTDSKHPSGIFHTREELQVIKKENIGIIEVMGLAILPKRLDADLHVLANNLIDPALLPDEFAAYKDWLETKSQKYVSDLSEGKDEQEKLRFLKAQISKDYENILEDCGVFKQDKLGQEALDAFIKSAL